MYSFCLVGAIAQGEAELIPSPVTCFKGVCGNNSPFFGGLWAAHGSHDKLVRHKGGAAFNVVALIVFLPDCSCIVGVAACSGAGACSAVWARMHDGPPG